MHTTTLACLWSRTWTSPPHSASRSSPACLVPSLPLAFRLVCAMNYCIPSSVLHSQVVGPHADLDASKQVTASEPCSSGYRTAKVLIRWPRAICRAAQRRSPKLASAHGQLSKHVETFNVQPPSLPGRVLQAAACRTWRAVQGRAPSMCATRCGPRTSCWTWARPRSTSACSSSPATPTRRAPASRPTPTGMPPSPAPAGAWRVGFVGEDEHTLVDLDHTIGFRGWRGGHADTNRHALPPPAPAALFAMHTNSLTAMWLGGRSEHAAATCPFS